MPAKPQLAAKVVSSGLAFRRFIFHLAAPSASTPVTQFTHCKRGSSYFQFGFVKRRTMTQTITETALTLSVVSLLALALLMASVGLNG